MSFNEIYLKQWADCKDVSSFSFRICKKTHIWVVLYEGCFNILLVCDFRHSINWLMTWNKHRCRFFKMIGGGGGLNPKQWEYFLRLYVTNENRMPSCRRVATDFWVGGPGPWDKISQSAINIWCRIFRTSFLLYLHSRLPVPGHYR